MEIFMKNQYVVTLLAALAVPAALPAQVAVPAAAEKAAAVIDQRSLEAPIRFLADDLLEGRGPATRADRLTELYLGATLEGLGFEPAFAKGSYVQPFDVVSVTADVPKTWDFHKGGQSLALKYWDQFIAASGVQEAKAALSNAEVVFVGYGIEAPQYKWDDFK